VAQRRGRERFVVEQPPYSIFARRIEADVLPTCEQYGLGVVVWSPLSQGWLTGRWRPGAEAPDGTHRQNLQPHLFDMSRTDNQRKLALVERLDEVAREAGIDLMHMAIAFVCQHPAVSAAIIGPRTEAQLEGLLAGSEVALGDDVLDAIDAIVAPGANVSHDDDGYVAPALADKARRRRRAVTSREVDRETLRNIEAYRRKSRGENRTSRSDD
jgi:aryl-alcohol dehydrogenase-like predicted oxidoreductase